MENLIKAGALDVLGGTRKQFMSIYIQIVDHMQQEKKNSMVGQMSLFDRGERGAEGRVSDQNAGCRRDIQRRTPWI